MKIQHYCYTRAKFLDYCVFSRPTNLDQFAIKEIKSKALSVTDSIESKLSTPKWILIKTPEYVVWGICCLNRILSEEYNCDYSGTPISGMFAVVISEYDNIQLPYDVEYFRRLYELEVSKFWTRKEAHICQVDEFIAGNFNFIRAIQNDNVNIINTDPFKCLSLGTTNKEDIISAALTLDNVSLLIDNDNIQQATNKKGAFMNCLSSAVAPGSYTVKQLCPQCKEYVSAFTSAGICSTCKEKEQARIVTIKKEEEDMDKQLRRELDDANSKILYLQYDIEEAKKSIKKKNLLIKVLLGVIVLLLLGLLYTYCASPSFGTMGYDKEQTNQHEVINNISSESKPSYENRLFLNSEIVVGVEGRQSLVVEYNKSYTNVDFIPNVDWVKVISKTPNLILQVQPYESDGRREAIITAKYGQYNDTLTITQKK